MRVLYVTQGFPYPLTSGNLRHYHLIRGLSERHDIHLLSTVGSDFRPEHADAMRPFCSGVETFRSTAGSSLWRKASERARDRVVGGGAPAAARALAAAVEQQLAQSPYDVILLNGRITTTVLEPAARTPLVVDLCDAVELRLSGGLQYSSAPRRALIQLKRRRMRDAEARLIAAGNHLLFASPRDREVALRGVATSPPSTVLPNGVDIDYWHRTRPQLGNEVVFSGNMRYEPNDDAARYLLNDVMPVVWEAEPDVRLRVIGRDPTDTLIRAAAGEPRVTLTGFVDDVRPHLEAGAVYAAPLRFASGIQNKLLEALAMELPVVTSPVGADGLRGDDAVEPPLVVASSADEFGAEILAALDNARRAPEPHSAGRAFVGDRFTWAQAVAILERVLERESGMAR
jgi:glycosyltransferase involved in cell wall biosynthesis